jgi:hypothetical protein
LATLLNHAIVNQPENDLAAAIMARREGSDPIAYVSPPNDEEDDRALRAAWAELAGESLPAGGVARVGMAGRDDTIPISWAALTSGLAELLSIRASWRPEPGPWLFIRPTHSAYVTPQDCEQIKTLETEAAAIDEMDAHAQVGDEPMTLIERRRIFLKHCQDAGIFAPDFPEARRFWLDYWFAERLSALRRAAVQLRSWGLLGEEEEPLTGRLCLDYARHELWPPGENGQRWARAGIRLVTPSLSGEQGVIVERVGGTTTRFWWRRDGDAPSLLAIARGL